MVKCVSFVWSQNYYICVEKEKSRFLFYSSLFNSFQNINEHLCFKSVSSSYFSSFELHVWSKPLSTMIQTNYKLNFKMLLQFYTWSFVNTTVWESTFSILLCDHFVHIFHMVLFIQVLSSIDVKCSLNLPGHHILLQNI